MFLLVWDSQVDVSVRSQAAALEHKTDLDWAAAGHVFAQLLAAF